MNYRQVLVQVDDRPGAASRAAAAAALAKTANAQLIGVFLKSEFMHNYGAGEAVAYMSPGNIDAVLKDHAAAVAKASERARSIFEGAAREADVVSEWLVLDGDADDALVACARRTDLAVFPVTATASCGQHVISAADLALASGGPVLVVPEAGVPSPIGKRVLIAWKGSRESARALHDAWPLIAGAQEVHVLIVAPEGEGGPDGLLQRHLEHHGRQANIIIDRSDDASAGDIIRRQAATLRADLIVMGLYGRPRLSELVLGGVSSDLLRDPPAPLLVSH